MRCFVVFLLLYYPILPSVPPTPCVFKVTCCLPLMDKCGIAAQCCSMTVLVLTLCEHCCSDIFKHEFGFMSFMFPSLSLSQTLSWRALMMLLPLNFIMLVLELTFFLVCLSVLLVLVLCETKCLHLNSHALVILPFKCIVSYVPCFLPPKLSCHKVC